MSSKEAHTCAVCFHTAIEIKTPEDWQAALETINWFHDAVTRSLVFSNDQRVGGDGIMTMGAGEAVLRAVVQTQSPQQPAANLIFLGVASFGFNRDMDVQPGEVAWVNDGSGGEALMRFAFVECEVICRSAVLTPLDWSASETAAPAV